MGVIETEYYFKLGDLPIMVCVLGFPDDGFNIGYCVAPPDKYDDVVARVFARRAAMRNRESFEQKRGARAVA